MEETRLLRERLIRLAVERGRVLVGLCGAPGAGKSTLAERLATELGSTAVVVPMDGFHLAASVIADDDRRDRRGAPDTFDGYGFVAAVARIGDGVDPVVYVPAYRRQIEDPIAGSIEVRPEHTIVLVEGNYLLLDETPWVQLVDRLDEIWYLELAAETVRRERLRRRHQAFGASIEEAHRRAGGSDERNAVRIAAGRDRADRIVTVDDDGRYVLSAGRSQAR